MVRFKRMLEESLDHSDKQVARTAFHALECARLHVKGRPLVLYNIWDAGSAKAVAAAGAPALATGSWSVAAAQGYADGDPTVPYRSSDHDPLLLGFDR